MDHVAIDLGGRESQICVRSGDGVVLEERRLPTRKLGEYLAKRASCRVIVETCAEAFAVADQALAAGHEVRVVPATLARALGVGANKQKTDRRDAQVLSEVSSRVNLQSVHIPSREARDAKTVCGMREALVGARTQLINTVRGWVRGLVGMQIKKGSSATFGRRVREAASAAKVTLPACVERQLRSIEQLNCEVAQADEEVEALGRNEPRCQRLQTVPGVGPVTSVRFVAALDQLGRFPSAHKVEAYLGLVPGQKSSSDRVRHTSITKAGPSAVRRVLVQACWSMRNSRPNDPLVRWSLEVEKRRGKGAAVVAMARKLAGILFAMLRDETTYQPDRTSTLGSAVLEHEAQQARDKREAALAMLRSKGTVRTA